MRCIRYSCSTPVLCQGMADIVDDHMHKMVGRVRPEEGHTVHMHEDGAITVDAPAELPFGHGMAGRESQGRGGVGKPCRANNRHLAVCGIFV